jgi:hypothetical protein
MRESNGAARKPGRSHRRPRNGDQNGGRYGQRQRGAKPAPAAGEFGKKILGHMGEIPSSRRSKPRHGLESRINFYIRTSILEK